MFGIKFVTGSNRKSFNFETVRRDFILLLINFLEKTAYLHVYVVSKRHAYNVERTFLVQGNFHKVRIARINHVVSTRD